MLDYVLEDVLKSVNVFAFTNKLKLVMKGNELELLIASLTTCNFFTNIVQFLKPLLSGHPLLSRHLGRSRKCPLNTGFTVIDTIIM